MIEILMRNCNSVTVFVVILNKRMTWLKFWGFFKPSVCSTFVFYKDLFHINAFGYHAKCMLSETKVVFRCLDKSKNQIVIKEFMVKINAIIYKYINIFIKIKLLIYLSTYTLKMRCGARGVSHCVTLLWVVFALLCWCPIVVRCCWQT